MVLPRRDDTGAPGPRTLPSGAATWERLSAFGPHVVDAGLLLGVTLLVLADLYVLYVAEGSTSRRALAHLAVSATAIPVVAVRRRWPLGSMLAAVAVILVASYEHDLLAPRYSVAPFFAPVAALGAVTTPVIRRQPVGAAITAGISGALATFSLVRAPAYGVDVLLLAILFGGTYVIGVGAGVYLRDLDRQQLVAAETARLDERMDLARELHDLVAHYVTGIVVQAQAARVVADRDPDAAGHALDQIEGAGKDALTAMRRLVGSLRNEGATAPTAPPVGLAGLDDLVSASSTLGLHVDLHVSEDAHTQVPGAVAASAHRIVQESLTNVRRHAEAATRAEVDVRVHGGALVVTVTDDGHQPIGGRSGAPGYGLVGMQERAHALGGTLVAGSIDPPAHGWRVQAVLPLDAPAAGTVR
ncbi:sensor histidine kinase [Aquihabitans sp. G128]|uniref:sensor histidine kinase n=1 Tax=Aquihabitans sp. G128 TaxID=2849779 RepID=UPI001C233FBC|nr:sensor histidine kinase [Aquihabitans sp. G128]QXC59769.1 sensor histidine kinase [Aquihabitans sp. G128]